MASSDGGGLGVAVPSTGWESAVIGLGDEIRSLRARLGEQEAVAERLREELAQTMMNLERVTALVQTHVESVQVVEQQEADGDQPQSVRQQEADSSHGGGGPRDPWAEFYQTASPDSVGNNDRTRFLKINSRLDKIPILEGDRAAFKD